MSTRTDLLQIKLEVDGEGRVKATLGDVSKQVGGVGESAKRASGDLGLLGKAAGAIGFATLLREAVAVNVEFERLGAVLKTLEGSQRAANMKMAELQDIARQTPSQLQEVVQAYSTLKARGLDPGREALLAYANVAAASGKTLQQFVEAVGDAATGETERLKEFGIVARQQGDSIALTFRGVTTVIEKDTAAIEGYLQRIGKVDFAGAAAAQMDTLGGAASNLQDALSKLAVKIGDSGLRGELKGLLQDLSAAADGLGEFLDRASGRQGGAGLFATFSAAAGAITPQGIIRGDLFNFLDDEVQRRQEAARAEITLLDRLGTAYRDLAGVVGGIYSKAQQQATQQQQAATEKTDKLLVKLREEAAAYGLSRSALLEREKAIALSTAQTEAHRTELASLYDTLIAKVKAEEADTKATKESTREDRAATQALEARRRVAQSMLEYYDPALRRVREYREAEEALNQAVEDGTITLGKRDAILRQLSYDQVIEQVREAGAAFRELPDQIPLDEIEGREVGLRFASGLSDGITDGLLTGDWESIGKQLLRSLFGDYVRTFLEQNLTRPLQQAIGNGSGVVGGLQQIFGGRGFESAPDFVGPPTSLANPGAVQGNSGTALASAVPILGWIYAGMQLNRSLYDRGWSIHGQTTETATTALAAGDLISALQTTISGSMDRLLRSLGVNGGTAAWLSGSAVLARIFGRRKPEIEAQGIEGSYGFGGFDGRRFADIEQDGGIFHGDRNWTEYQPLSADIDRMFDRAISDIRRGALRIGETLGVDIADALDALRFDARIELSDDPEEARRQMEEYVRQMQDALAQGALDALNAGRLPELSGLSATEALAGLGQLTEFIDGLGSRLDQLSADPLVQMQLAIDQLSRAQTNALDDLQSALESFDPSEIASSAAEAEQAIVARFRAEIDMARSLEAALLQAQAAARATDLQLSQRIQATGGPAGLVAGVARGNFETLRGLVGGTSDPERALAFLSEFVGNVDTWLSSSIADVQMLAAAEAERVNLALAGIEAQRETIGIMLQSLAAERDAILANATARAQAEFESQRAAVQAMQQEQEALRRAEIEGLQQQLDLAERFADVVREAESYLQDLTRSLQSPLSGFSRLNLLGGDIDRAEDRLSGATGADRAAAAQELLALLQQRLQLVQGEGLFDRSSNDYLALFNDTVRRVSEVRDLAQPEADRAIQLQEILNDLQRETTQAIQDLGGLQVRLTAEEQLQLDRIAEREQALNDELLRLELQQFALNRELVSIQERAEAEIAALNAQAREQYEWARGEAQRLEAERQQQIVDQLNVLTGGRPVDQFIADRSAEATRLLTDIRDDLRDFLEAIAGASVDPATPPGGDTAPGPGRGGQPPRTDIPSIPGESSPGLVFAPSITVNAGTGADGAQIGRVVMDEIVRQAPMIATLIRREARYA